MDGACRLVDKGVTDLRANVALPEDPGAAASLLDELVAAFRAAVGR